MFTRILYNLKAKKATDEISKSEIKAKKSAKHDERVTQSRACVKTG